MQGLYPRTQEHLVNASLPPSEPEFAGQEMHAPDPITDLYVPAGQAVHSPPSGPVYPALHEQSVT